MLSLLKTKLALLVQTKAGVALIGAVLVAGGGTAVAVTAAHNGLGPLGSTLSPSTTATENDQNDNEDKNHVSAEGILTVYTATGTGATISVKTEDKGTLTFTVDSHTRINGGGSENDGHAQGTAQPEGTDHPEGTAQPEGTDHPEGTAQPEATDHPESDGPALTLADLEKAVNHRVQVQGARQTDGSNLATKVTIQGAGNQNQHEGDGTEAQGMVASVGAGSFVLTTEHGPVTVHVNGSTQFKNGLTGLGSVAGKHVQVQGVKQSDGSILASVVTLEQTDGSEGTQAPAGTQTPGHD